MTIRITTSARSPLGQVIALTLITVPLVVFGTYLATGDITAGDTVRMQGVIKGLFTAKWLQAQGVSLSTAMRNHFKGFGRLELLVYYGVAILVAFLAQGVLGRFIRSYRFVFGRGGMVQRREMWLYVQVWALAWVAAGGLLWAIFGGSRGLVIGAVAPGVALAPLWVWRREWLTRELFVPGLSKRVAVGKIKRMEVVAGPDGGAALVVVFHDDWTWTIARGSPGRLQRVGAAVGRVAGLERRDVVTWA